LLNSATQMPIMVRLLFFLAAFVWCPRHCFAQYEFNSWRFGLRAGLDFPPTLLASPPAPVPTNDIFYSLEASAVVADSTGALLCYSNGEQVWNRQNRLMANGTLRGGCNSAAQGALLLPRPGFRQQYFLFTVDCHENRLSGGLRYSVVDMAQNAGLGAVQTPNSLQVFLPGFNIFPTEALTAVRNANGTDYWVVVHCWQSDVFLSYPVLFTGLGTPVQSRVGSVHGAGAFPLVQQAYGSLRASPNGQWLAASIPDQNAVELFDFDNRSGRVSAVRRVPLALPSSTRPYGLEFSADNQLLYLTSSWVSLPTTRAEGLYQVDLRSPGLQVAQVATGEFGALLRGPDNRIYMTTNLLDLPVSSLGVVNAPNVLGTGCQFLPAGVSLGLGRRMTGLPNFANRIRQRLRIAYSGEICVGEAMSFTATTVAMDPAPGAGVVALAWDFGDPAAGAANAAAGSAAQHRFARAGRYTVTLTAAAAAGPVVTQVSFTVGNRPILRVQPRDTLVCEEQGILLHASAQQPGTLFRWQDGSTGSSLNAKRTGLYRLEVRNSAGCTARDSVFVNTYACPVVVPNLITPNGDNQNQTFVLKGLNAPDWSLHLYNRWGREIYAKEKYDNRWAADNHADGTYFYLLVNSITSQKIKGWVEVRR